MNNAITVFDNDLCLLFANKSFYNLFSTSRELLVGLPILDVLEDIFDISIHKNHPLYHIIQQSNEIKDGKNLQNNQSLQYIFKKNEFLPKMVDIKVYDLIDQLKKPNSILFTILFEDITKIFQLNQEILKEKENFTSILSNINSNNSNITNFIQYDDAIVLYIGIHSNQTLSEKDDLFIGILSILLKVIKDEIQRFPEIIKIIQDPPEWYFLIIPNLNEGGTNPSISICQFCFNVLESFQHLSTGVVNLICLAHIGSLKLYHINKEIHQFDLFGNVIDFIEKNKKLNTKSQLIISEKFKLSLINQKSIFLKPTTINNFYEAIKAINISDEN